MNEEIKNYLKTEALIAGAFNFFINGMIAALVHHKTDIVPVDAISVAVDLTATCLLMFILTALFDRASIRRTKTAGILKSGSRVVRFLSRLFGHPVWFGVLTDLVVAIIQNDYIMRFSRIHRLLNHVLELLLGPRSVVATLIAAFQV